MTSPLSLDAFAAGFDEEPGYLDFATVAPVGAAVQAEERAMMGLLARSRFGSLTALDDQDLRLREAVAALSGFDAEQIAFQPTTRDSLRRVIYGLPGRVAVRPAGFPGGGFGITSAEAAPGGVAPLWLESDHGRVTPGNLRAQLTDDIVAVAVSVVDAMTGYFVDLEGIREVIGDRLLIVDARQGFAIVDAPWQVADVVVSGGQTWARAGWGTGFLALSERAVDRLAPASSEFAALDGASIHEGLPSTTAAGAFGLADADPVAQARFAGALEEIAEVGVPAINSRLALQTARLIALADEFAVEVVSPRDDAERAGIVVIRPPAERMTALTASLHNHGISVTAGQGMVRLSPHVTTHDDTFGMLRSSLVAYSA